MTTPNTQFDFLSGTLDPRITFSRADATATRVNAIGLVEIVAADTPRFDYNPANLSAEGLLIEPQSTNLVKYSSNFDNEVWVKIRATITTAATVSPDGAANAQKLVETATSGTHLIAIGNAQISGVTVGQQFTFSTYLKAGERTRAQLFLINDASTFGALGNIIFDLSNGTIVSTTNPQVFISWSIHAAGNGWYRIQATSAPVIAASTFTASTNFFAVRLVSSGTTTSYLGDGTSGLFEWGAQLELADSATSYIPTEAASVTRNADVATITGTNFSDWWQAGKGGAQVQAISSTVFGIRPLVQYDDGTADNIIALRGNAANPELQIVDGGAPQVQLDAGTIVANTPYSLTGWWQTNDCKARKDSGAVVTDDTASIPTVTQARLGSDGTNYLNGHLVTVNYYDSFFGQSIYTRRKNKVIFSLL